jgi:large subunit ribosomal protein L25
MKVVTLNVEPRQLGSKGDISALRKSGKVPAVFYGKDIKSKSISVDSKTFISIIEENGANVIIDLNFKDEKKSTIVKFLQRDVITQCPIHIDFQSISLESEVEVLVPIHIDGVADGVKNFGGVMEFIVREVKIKALPKSIPQKINVDVSALGIGHGVTIADLPKLDGISYVQDPSTLIINVVAMSLEEEKPAAEGEEAAQPEVISKGKKDKEGEEAATVAAPTVGTKK